MNIVRYFTLTFFFVVMIFSRSSLAVDVIADIDVCNGPPPLTAPVTTTESVPTGTDPINIMFIIDDSGSMGSEIEGAAPGTSRWDALRQHVSDLTNDWLSDISAGTIPTLNVGISLLRGGSRPPGATVAYPAVPLTATSRNEINLLLSNNPNHGNTPLADAMYETALYLRGDAVDLGKTRGNSDSEILSAPTSYTGGSVSPAGCNQQFTAGCSSEEITGAATYISPITATSTKSHIIMFSDGHSNNQTRESEMATLMGLPDATACNTVIIQPERGSLCMLDFARWLSTTDHSTLVPDNQVIRLHTISYGGETNPSENFMSDIAAAGGGIFNTASNYTELKNAFDDIVDQIISTSTTTSAVSDDPWASLNHYPAYEVSAINRSMTNFGIVRDPNDPTQNANYVYATVYKPNADGPWQGNLKKYNLTQSTTILTGGPPTDQSEKEELLINGATEDAAQGGAAAQLPSAASRKLYSNLVDGLKDLTAGANRIKHGNILPEHLVYDTNANEILPDQITSIVDWVTGAAPGQENFIGDPTHSSPVIVDYSPTRRLVFFGTNQGYLHAVDGNSLVEQWAFMPKQLMKKLPELSGVLPSGHYWDLERDYFTLNTVGVPKINSHIFGFATTSTVWIHNVGDKNVINAGEGDKVWLFMGMRRGGRDYFAFDITNPDAPKLEWQIKGGEGDFTALAQSWSEPTIANVKVGGTLKTVLIFGGGYDLKNDTYTHTQLPPGSPPNYNLFTANSNHYLKDTANRIYIVDAESGTLLWRAGGPGTTGSSKFVSPDMIFAIPAPIATLDVNKDEEQLIDKFFAADVGGNIWRCDIDHSKPNWNSAVKCGRLANFNSGPPDPLNFNPKTHAFFYRPEVLLVNNPLEPSRGDFIALNIGSGVRPKIFYKIDQHDKFFSLFIDDDVFTPKTSFGAPIEIGDLTDMTDGSATVPPGAKGWYINLRRREPGLAYTAPDSTGPQATSSEATTILGLVSFKTSAREGPASPSCAQKLSSTIYYRELFTGQYPLYYNPATDQLERDSGAYSTLDSIGSSKPQLIIRDNVATILSGFRQVNEAPELFTLKRYQDSSWVQKPEEKP